jgi:hypothetical protein
LNYYNYYTEIEDAFVRRRGKNLFLSPLDWALIELWQDRGIPLHVVIRSIESVFDVFDKQPAGTRSIKSLFYCREEVEVQFAEWSRSQAGKSTGNTVDGDVMFTPEQIGGHIETAIGALMRCGRAELAEDIERSVARLDELRGDLTDNFEAIDGTLSDIEKLLDRAMLTNWDREHLRYLEKEVAAPLKEYKASMEPDAYANMFELMMLKRLREEAGIPRLGLFYL